MMDHFAANPAALLSLADGQKRLIDPLYRRKERVQGLLPTGRDLPFGNFPPESSSKQRRVDRNMPMLRAPVQKLREPNSSKQRGDDSEFGGGRWQNGGPSHAVKAPTLPPPNSRALRRRKITPSALRKFYERGDLPLLISHGSCSNGIAWKVSMDTLDYHFFLPVFFDGLREKEDPFRFLAVQGVHDLLKHGGSRILPVVPQLILPIKTSLNTRDPEVICTVLNAIQSLVLAGDHIGESLVQYYRQILPIFNLMKNRSLNLGDQIDYSQIKRQNVGNMIEETLGILEKHGGPDAFINIKYMIPTYESHTAS